MLTNVKINYNEMLPVGTGAYDEESSTLYISIADYEALQRCKADPVALQVLSASIQIVRIPKMQRVLFL